MPFNLFINPVVDNGEFGSISIFHPRLSTFWVVLCDVIIDIINIIYLSNVEMVIA